MKENKPIVTRYNKLDASFMSFIALAAMKVFKLLC